MCWKTSEFSQRKLNEFNKQKQIFANTIASFKVAYRISKCRTPYSNGESSVLSPTDIVEIMHGESYAKELQKTSLTNNTVGRRTADILDL
jgi:hypothetical protein